MTGPLRKAGTDCFSPRATDSQDALNLSELLQNQGNDHHENAFKGVLQ